MDINDLKQLERFSSFFSIVTFWFGTRQKMATWPISIAISLMNLPLYYFDRLYGSFFQNIISVIVSLYGWYSWRYGGKGRTELKIITRTSLKEAVLLFLGICLYSAVMTPTLTYLISLSSKPNATITLFDVLRSALTMAGMWLTSHKKIETYPTWFFVNAIAVFIFFQKERYYFMAKYLFMLCLSVYSFYVWYGQYTSQTKGGAVQ